MTITRKKPVTVKVDGRTVQPGTPEHTFRAERSASSRGVVRGDVTPEEHAEQFLGMADPYTGRPELERTRKAKTTAQTQPQVQISPQEQARREEQQKAVQEQQRTIWEKIAGVGLAPAAIIGNLLTGGLELITGEKYGRTDPFELAETPAGKALGMATMTTAIALGTAIVAKVLIGGTVIKGGTITYTSQVGVKATSPTIVKAISAFGNPAASKVSLLFQAAKNLGPIATKSLLTKVAWTKIGYGAAALSGTSGIMTWLASDNIMQGISMHVKSLPWAVRNGAISREEGLSAISEMQEWKNYAEGFVKVNSKINPVLWPFGKILLINAKKVQRDIDLETQNIIFAGMKGMPIR